MSAPAWDTFRIGFWLHEKVSRFLVHRSAIPQKFSCWGGRGYPAPMLVLAQGRYPRASDEHQRRERWKDLLDRVHGSLRLDRQCGEVPRFAAHAWDQEHIVWRLKGGQDIAHLSSNLLEGLQDEGEDEDDPEAMSLEVFQHFCPCESIGSWRNGLVVLPICRLNAPPGTHDLWNEITSECNRLPREVRTDSLIVEVVDSRFSAEIKHPFD